MDLGFLNRIGTLISPLYFKIGCKVAAMLIILVFEQFKRQFIKVSSNI